MLLSECTMLPLSIVFLLHSQHCYTQTLLNDRPLPFIQETIATKPVQNDPDDPAVWIHPTNSQLSLLLGTDKKKETGGLFVFDLDGRILQHFTNIDRPNNVDVEYGFKVNHTYSIDLAILTERNQRRLRIYSIDPHSRRLTELEGGNTSVFTNDTGNSAAPMGIGLYKRVNDGTIYAVVSRKIGPSGAYLGQYELVWNGRSIDLRLIRYFGDYQGAEIESIVIDDSLGHIYYSDEKHGIRKYNVDPSTNQTTQLGFINTTDVWHGDSEGLALYTKSGDEGYLIITDQIASGSIFHIYERRGNNAYLGAVKTRAVKTDGIEATSSHLNWNFPNGMLIVMNEIDRNFLVYDWREIEKGLKTLANLATNNHLNFISFLFSLLIANALF